MIEVRQTEGFASWFAGLRYRGITRAAGREQEF